MSNSLKPRVVRKHKTKQLFKATNYRKMLPFLLADFEQRCAYSMVHVLEIGTSQMHIDHHDPRKKRKSPYTNLFPAYSICNGAKGNEWPSDELQKKGVRFLNPCDEADYDHQIFEDPETHDLIGTTPAADYHITMLDLNNPALVRQRMERSLFAKILSMPAVCRGASPQHDAVAAAILRKFLDIQATKIPQILPPPVAKAG